MKRRYRIVALLAFVLAVTSACAKAPPTLSPAGTAAFHARKVVKTLDVLRDFAVDAEAQTPKVISTNTTRKVVLMHREVVRVIGEVPNGWRPIVEQAIDSFWCSGSNCPTPIPEGEKVKLAPYVALVKAVIQEVR